MKRLAAVMLILLLTGAGTGAVLAYLTAQDQVENKITAASTDIRIEEKFQPPEHLEPGDIIPKTVQVLSTSDRDCYIRVMLKFSSLEAENFCEPLTILDGWTRESDGYYYWKEKVKPGESTGQLISSVNIKQNISEKELEDFEILVYAEAVSCQEESMEEAWRNMN